MNFRHMDGERTLRSIYDSIISSDTSSDKTLDYETLAEEFGGVFSALISSNFLHLRHHSVPAYKTIDKLHARQQRDMQT